jgi:hypothetical protein
MKQQFTVYLDPDAAAMGGDFGAVMEALTPASACQETGTEAAWTRLCG